MCAIVNNEIVPVPLEEVAGKLKKGAGGLSGRPDGPGNRGVFRRLTGFWPVNKTPEKVSVR